MSRLIYCHEQSARLYRRSFERLRCSPTTGASFARHAAFIGLTFNDDDQMFLDLRPTFEIITVDASIMDTSIWRAFTPPDEPEEYTLLSTRPIIGLCLETQNLTSFQHYAPDIITLLHQVNAIFPGNQNGKLDRYARACRRTLAVLDQFHRVTSKPLLPWQNLIKLRNELKSFDPEEFAHIDNFFGLRAGQWREERLVLTRETHLRPLHSLEHTLRIDGGTMHHVSVMPDDLENMDTDDAIDAFQQTVMQERPYKELLRVDGKRKYFRNAALARGLISSPFRSNSAQIDEIRALYMAFASSTSEYDRACYALLIASANTGLALDVLYTALPGTRNRPPDAPRFRTGYSIMYHRHIPVGHENERPDHAVYLPSSSECAIIMPPPLAALLRSTDPAQNLPNRFRDRVTSLLRTINGNGAALSAPRIKNSFMAHYINRWGLDEMDAGIVANTYPPTIQTQMNYTRFDSAKLAERYHEAFMRAHAELPPIMMDSGNIPNVYGNRAFGSRVVARPAAVTSVFHYLHEQIRHTSRGNSIAERIRHHNYLSTHALLALQLLTGHRPVANPGSCRSLFLPRQNMIYIHDKDSAHFSEKRHVPLHPAYRTLLDQLQSTRTALFRQIGLTQNTHITSGNHERLTDLLFLLDSDLGREWFTKSRMEAMLNTGVYHPNFLRHWLRTWLLETGRSKLLIDHVFGHASEGTEPMNMLSGLDPASLRRDVIAYQAELLARFRIIEGVRYA